MISREVKRCDVRIAARAHRRDECSVHRGQSVFGSDYEHRERGESGVCSRERPLLSVCQELVRHLRCGRAGQRLHVVRHFCHHFVSRHSGYPAHVRRGDEHCTAQPMLVRCGEHRHPSAHAMPRKDKTRGIDTERARVGRIAEKGEHRACVLQVLREPERARASPRSAIVERYRVPSGAAHGLGEIEILLIPWQPVEQHERGVRAGSRRDVRDSVDLHIS